MRLRLPLLAIRRKQNRATIVLYHGVTREQGDGIFNYRGKFVNTDSFRKHIDWMQQHFTILPLAALVESIGQEVFLRAFRFAPTYRYPQKFSTWMFTVARNLYVSYCRSRMLDYDARAALHVWPERQVEASPFEMTSANELQQRIEVALAALPGAYREALLLVAFEGLTPTEAAEICGVSGETMRQRLSRARVMLAKRLDPAAAAGGIVVPREVLP